MENQPSYIKLTLHIYILNLNFNGIQIAAIAAQMLIDSFIIPAKLVAYQNSTKIWLFKIENHNAISYMLMQYHFIRVNVEELENSFAGSEQIFCFISKKILI